MDEIEALGIMGHQQILAQRRAEWWDKQLAAARLEGERTGYVKALDDVMNVVKSRFSYIPFFMWTSEIVGQLKSDYQEVEDGKNK